MAPLLVFLAFSASVEKPSFELDRSGMDLEAVVQRPQDLNQLANGRWYADPQEPDSSFGRLMNFNTRIVEDILRDAGRSPAAAKTPESRLSRYMSVARNQALANRLGVKPIQPLLDVIERVKDRHPLALACGRLLVAGVDAPIRLSVVDDENRPRRKVVRFALGGQYLWDGSGYRDQGPRSAGRVYARVAEDYARRVGKGPYSNAHGLAAIEMEASLAVDSVRPGAPQATSMDSLQRATPNVPWSYVWLGAGIQSPVTVEVRSQKQMAVLNELFTKAPAWKWRAYLRNQVLMKYSTYLDDRTATISDPLSAVLFGREVKRNRERDVTDSASNVLGHEIGFLYAKKVLTRQHVEQVRAVAENVRRAFRARLATGWLTEPSKRRAIAKLDRMRFQIGQPDFWTFTNESDLQAGSWPEIIQRTSATKFREEWKSQFKTTSAQLWGDAVSTIGASYDAPTNSVTIPAGMMHAPFFAVNADPALVYGALGSVIAHEITHGFDRDGARFGPNGLRDPLLDDESLSQFQSRVKLVSAQYEGLTNKFGHPISTELTADENIADVGGVNIAFDAFSSLVKSQNLGVAQGFSPAQRFFLAYAQAFRGKFGEAFEKSISTVDPHAPLILRSWVPPSLCPGFYEAFGLAVPEGGLPRLW